MTALGQQIIDNVRRIAAENPDFVYQPGRDGDTGRFLSCVYVKNGCGSCLIGQALFEAGVIDAGWENSTNNHIPFIGVADALSLPLDAAEVRWLGSVQKHQDNFRPWGKAVEWTDNPPIKKWTVD